MKEAFKKMSDVDLHRLGIEVAKIEFISRAFRELSEIESLDKKAILSLLWDCYFSIISPIEQTLWSFHRYNKATRSKKWEYICQYDFDLYMKYKNQPRKKTREQMLQEFADVLNVSVEYIKKNTSARPLVKLIIQLKKLQRKLKRQWF